jgi:hypothetical protein
MTEEEFIKEVTDGLPLRLFWNECGYEKGYESFETVLNNGMRYKCN